MLHQLMMVCIFNTNMLHVVFGHILTYIYFKQTRASLRRMSLKTCLSIKYSLALGLKGGSEKVAARLFAEDSSCSQIHWSRVWKMYVSVFQLCVWSLPPPEKISVYSDFLELFLLETDVCCCWKPFHVVRLTQSSAAAGLRAQQWAETLSKTC